MKGFETCSHLSELLVKSLQGTLSPAEEAVVEAWRKEHAAHEAFYSKITSEAFWRHHPQQVFQQDIVAAWLRQVERQRKRRLHIRLRRWSAAVAVIVLCFGSVTLWYTSRQAENGLVVADRIPESENGKQVELIFGDGTRMVLDASANWLQEKGASIKKEAQTLEYKEDKGVKEIAQNTLRIPRGAEYNLILSDGTKVFLNAESEITYPVRFGQGTREVQLKGEAFFDVHQDKAHPFIVHTASFDVQVTGTRFNVRSYAEETPSATLAEGGIQLQCAGKTTPLGPGQQASLVGGQIQVREVDLETAIAWRYNAFSFKQQPLENLLTELARWYDLEIFYLNPALKKLHFTAWFKRDSSLAEVIEILERTQKVIFEIKGKTIIVKQYK